MLAEVSGPERKRVSQPATVDTRSTPVLPADG